MSNTTWLPASILLSLITYGSFSYSAPLQFYIGPASFTSEISQPNITAIHKDSSGYLWIGTQSGLNKYNGSSITVFNSSDTSKEWVPASYITEVSEDSKGTIWIATYGGGLARYDEDKNSFDSPSGHIDSRYAFPKSLFLSSTGKVWFGTRENGIGMYDPVLDRYSSWVSMTDIEIGIAEDFLEDEQGRIWVAGNNGLYMIDLNLQSVTFHPLPTIGSSVSLRIVTTLEQGPDDQIWLGTRSGNIFTFSLSNFTYDRFDTPLNTKKGWITDLAYTDSKLWIAKDNGITVIDMIENLSSTYSHTNSNLSSDFISCLLAEKNFVLVGTARGLNFLAPTPFENFQSTNSHIFDDVSSFSERANGEIWIGTFDGIYLLDETRKSHQLLEEIFEGIELSDRRITAIDITNDEMWLGFFHGGVQIIDLTDGSVQFPNLPMNSDLGITSISHSQDGSIWVGTYNKGLFQINGNEVFSYYGSSDSKFNIPESAIMSVVESDGSNIIIAAENGLYTIDPVSGRVANLGKLFPNQNSQPVLTSAAKSNNGDIWVALRDRGLFALHQDTDSPDVFSIQPIKDNSKLPSTTIYAIEFDKQGSAWVSTSQGIAKLNSEGELQRSYTVTDGLQGNDFNIASSFKDSQGRIYFGGSNGYNRFDPDHSTSVSSPPPVALTQLIVAGDEPQLPVAIHKLESIVLSYLDYFVTLEFSVLDYVDPRNNQYRYKLENFDPNWIENGTRNSATYTNLPAGKYTFRVQGANSAGIWNRDGISLEIIVLPAPWLSWQAYLFYIVMFMVALLLAKKYYDNTVLRKKATAIAQEMHDTADRATDDLQEQLEYQDEFVKLVHTHSINTLSLVSEFISQQAAYVEDDLAREAILNNSERVAALAQLEGCLFYQGDELLANLKDFTHIVISQLVEESPSIAASIITINEIPARLVSAEIATPLSIVIFELLRNSFHHAFEDVSSTKYIHIRLESIPDENSENGSMMKLTVEDNGVGIPDNLSASTVETSGLAIVSSIARKLNGTVSMSSSKGTNISLVFPV